MSKCVAIATINNYCIGKNVIYTFMHSLYIKKRPPDFSREG